MSAIATAPHVNGGFRGHRVVPVQPFVDWVMKRIADHVAHQQTEYEAVSFEKARKVAHQEVLFDLGWGDGNGARRFYRWASGEQLTGQARLSVVEEALEHVGLMVWDLYPDALDDYGDPIDRWCDTCREVVMTDDTLVCPWCESSTSEVMA